MTRLWSLGSTTRMPSFVSSVADSSSRVRTTRVIARVPSSYSTFTSAHSSAFVYCTRPSARAALRLFGDARRRATDMEGAERELRTRLADRLRGQDADRLAHVHHVHRGQVAAVAHAADAAARFARQDAANLHLLDPGVLDAVRDVLVDELPGLDQQARIAILVELVRVEHILARYAADDALAQRLDDVLPLLERRDLEAEDRTAILLGDRDVLRHVHEPPRQVAGVGGLERGIGEALAGAVRRDEVLEHAEPLTEVRPDRALDDLTDAAGELLLRLGHEAAHAGELPDLVPAAARARVEHHEDGVEPALAQAHAVHHRLGHVVVRVGPGVDHLVVPLAEGDLAGVVRLLEALDALVGLVQELHLLGRDLEILDTDRDAALRGEAEAELLQPVEKGDRVGQPRPAVRLEHQTGELLLLHQEVAEPELGHHAPRHDAVEQDAPNGGPEPARRRLRRLTRRYVPEVDRLMELHRPGEERHLDLGQRAVVSRILPEPLLGFLATGARLPQVFLEAGRQLRKEVAPQHHVL